MPKQIQRIIVLLLLAVIFSTTKSFAQKKNSVKFKLSGYMDVYFAGYTDSVEKNSYQKFPVISPKNNALGLNIAQLTAQLNSNRFRSTVTLHYGDIPLSAWSPSLNLIQEANVGVKLGKKIWFDAGFFKTHIGTEAFVPKDNIASSLSIITFYEPWFQTGVKLSYTPNDKFFFCMHALLGYNIFVENNKKKSFGISASYTFNEKGSIGYYNLFGDETPDSIHTAHFRFLNNVVFNYQVTPKLKVQIGGDIIAQGRSGIIDSNKTAIALGGIATLKYQFIPKLGIYVRGEIFDDKNGFLTGVINDAKNKLTGYKLWGITGGLEYKPEENSFIRLEGRQLQMDKNQPIFRWKGKDQSNRIELMLHAGYYF